MKSRSVPRWDGGVRSRDARSSRAVTRRPATLRSYGPTCASSPSGPASGGREPGKLATATCAASPRQISERGLARSSVARKLAAIRASASSWSTPAWRRRTPLSCCRARSGRRGCLACSRPDDVARLLDRIPAIDPLEVRDRAMFELAYSCGLRAAEICGLDVGDLDFESRDGPRSRARGRKERIVPIGEPAQAALRRYLEHRSSRARRAPGRERALPLAPRPAALTPPMSGAGSSAGFARRRSPAGSRRTFCVTPSQRTCSRVARTYDRSRSCLATPASRRPRSTLGSNRDACAASTHEPTREHESRPR